MDAELEDNIDWQTKAEIYRLERDIFHLEVITLQELLEFYQTPGGHQYLGMLSEKKKFEKQLDNLLKEVKEKWVGLSPR